MFNKLIDAKPGDRLTAVPIGHDGKPVPYAEATEVDPNLARQHAGYYHIQQDLLNAIRTIEVSTQSDSSISTVATEAMLVSAVISYGRCFTDADGRGIKLDAGRPWIDEESKRWHAELMNMRHQIFAHAGSSPYSKTGTLVLLDSKENPQNVQLFCLSWHLANVSKEDLLSITQHLKKICHQVTKKLDEVGQILVKKAYKKYVDPKFEG